MKLSRSNPILPATFLFALAAAACGTTKDSTTPGAGGSGGGADGSSSGGAGGGSGGAGGAGGSTVTDAGTPPTDAGGTIQLHIAGDSTAAIFPATDPTMRVGWGAVLQPFFGAGVRVNDAARSGRSSKSFIDEGFWTTLKGQIRAGDYVFIQFAHNDEKTEDSLRYTDPATTFRDNLRRYVSETRAAGGVPILLTPIARRQFSGAMVAQTHGAYPAAVVAVAEETSTPVIDMTEKTSVWLEALGPTNSVPMFAAADNTHLSALGAPMVATRVVDGIRELGLTPLVRNFAP